MAQYTGSAYAQHSPEQYPGQYAHHPHSAYATQGSEGQWYYSEGSPRHAPTADSASYAADGGLSMHPGLYNVPEDPLYTPQRAAPPQPKAAMWNRHESAPAMPRDSHRTQPMRQESAMSSSTSLPGIHNMAYPSPAPDPTQPKLNAYQAAQHGRSQSLESLAYAQHPLKGATLSYSDSPKDGMLPPTPSHMRSTDRLDHLPTALSNVSIASSARSDAPGSPKSIMSAATPDTPSRSRTREGSRSSLKSMLGGLVHSVSDVFGGNERRPEISTPYDPVHLTHVGFNARTGEFTGLPREWQQLLHQSGISRQEVEQHPQAVMDIVAFYQDNAHEARSGGENDDVWTKFGANVADDSSSSQPYEGEWEAGAYAAPAPAPLAATRVPPPVPTHAGGVQPPMQAQAPAPPQPQPQPQPPASAPTPPATAPSPTQPAMPSAPPGPGRVSPSFRPPELLHSTKSTATQPTVEGVTSHTYNPAADRPADSSSTAAQLVRNQSQRVAAASAATGRAEPDVRPPLGSSGTVPRRRTQKNKVSDAQVMARLQAVCTPGNPNRMFKDLVKIGQGASGGVFTAKSIGSEQLVAIKQMVLEQQPKKDLIVNEIEVMKQSRHPNIVNFLNAFLNHGELWVVMEYMEGGPLTDVVLNSILSEPQIAAVAKECLTGLHHLHTHGVIHRDIKSDNVLMSMNGNIKLSTYARD